MRKSVGIISAFLVAGLSVFAQQYTINTVAGGASLPNAPVAVNAPIGNPGAMTSDNAGNVYFISNNAIYRIDPGGGLTRIAGNSRPGFSGDGGTIASTQGQFNNPTGLAIDSSNNLYVADTGNNRIRKVYGPGYLTTVAGIGPPGYAGDNGPASNAALNAPQGVAVDSSGNLYIADTGNNVIRKITSPGSNGVITTVAGNGTAGISGDGQPATSAQLNTPIGVAVDPSGNIYIADSKNNRIREVSSLIMSTIAGNGIAGFFGDGNLATLAQLNLPTQVAVAPSLQIYLLDSGNTRVREIMTNRVISTVAGGGGPITNPQGITTDTSSNLYVADISHVILRFSSATPPAITSFAGNGSSYALGDGGPATSAQLVQPEGLAVDSASNVYIADHGESRIRKIPPGGNGNISSPAGATAIAPAGTAVDLAGNIYIADAGGNVVVRVSGGVPTTIAGTGTAGFSGDNFLATTAQVNQPNGVAVDSAGNVYIADTSNNRVRKITAASNIMTTIAGSFSQGFQGDNGPANSALLNQPAGVAVDTSGNVYIADTGNNRIRKITAATGIITTVAGNGSQGYSGDGGQATSAAIASPHGIAVDSLLNLYIPDYTGRVRKVSVGGIITTIAGTTSQGYSGDGGPATSAQLNTPWGVTVDGSNNVYVSDVGSQAVRELVPAAASALSILTTSPLPTGTVGIPYGQALAATGGTPPYTWTIAIGSLPAGLTLSPGGSISGTPTGTSAQFTVQVTDSASVTAQTTLVIVINPANSNGLTITTPSTLPSGAVINGVPQPYFQTLNASSGNPPYTWTLVSGALPAGLSLSPSGLISGTPSTSGSSSFTVRVNDVSNAVASQNFTLQVINAGTLSRTGALAHFAAGGPWTTRAYLTNISTSPVAVNLVVHTDDGSILPMSITQLGLTQQNSTNSFTGVMNPSSTIVVNAGTGLSNTVTGWIDVLGSGSANSIAGFAIFRTLLSNGAVSEGTSPLQTQFESRLDVPFDNTGGYNTDLALANLSNSATTVTATVLDTNGTLLGTYSLSLNANGHLAFLFPSQFGVSANQQGLVQFVNASGGNLAGVGLRANTGAATGAFTSVPVILP